jgi:uncharacterized protein YdaL/uncharacterized lipoprotein YddW (UPF0748 family)
VKRRRLLLLVLLAAALYLALPQRRSAGAPCTFLPRIARMAGVRFDPAYFYDRGLTARELAAEVVTRWSEAQLDTVFFRAYDPGYGANYRTDLAWSQETDYGSQDLLRFVLEEAHARGMKVYAWLTMLNHRGAWEVNEDWRARRANGEAYSSVSLPFPLCARQPGAREWWLGFVDELLERYPELDGVDLAEPALSWKAGETCGCRHCTDAALVQPGVLPGELRAAPLTDIVLETLRRARARGRSTAVTTVLPSDASGNPLPFAALRDQTGLDLEAVLASESRPQVLSVQILWQEWADATKNEAVFRPPWARVAVAETRRRVAGRTRVVAHLELTDFGSVTVDPDELEASVAAALEAGADGYEVYDAALLEKKDAWDSLSRLSSKARARRVLVLHSETGEGDAWQLATLFGHFQAEAMVKPVSSYAAGEANGYDALAYVGTDDRSTLGEPFLEEVRRSEIPVLWIGSNLGALLERNPELGLTYLGSRPGAAFDSVRYEGSALPRKGPILNAVEVADPRKVEVLAEMISGEETLPYALRAGRLWYFADNPTSFAVEGSSYVVLADLLHDVLGEDHEPQKLALVRLEDIHPLTPPEDLLGAARALHARGVPFLIALVPFYAYPEKGEFASLDDEPEFVAALEEAVRLGGTVVLHGVTHQRDGESTADYEFWDRTRGGPPEGRADARTRSRLLLGLRECGEHGIYPLLWETPHYAAPLADYRVVAEVFSAAVERRQTADRIGTDQLYPYVIRRDRFGQLLLPENLGYVPLEDQRAAPILAAAARTAVVRDATVGFFFHVFCKQAVLEEIVDGLLDQGFSFPDVRSLELTVSGPDFGWCTTRAAARPGLPGLQQESRVLDAAGRVVWQGPLGSPSAITPEIGLRVVEAARASEAAPPPRPGVTFLSRPLDVGILAEPGESRALAELFASVAAPCRVLEPIGDRLALPAEMSLLVVGAGASPALLGELGRFLEQGGVVLTWGRTPLSEGLGVRFLGEVREVGEVVERDYGTAVRLSAPQRVDLFAPAGEVVAEGKDGGPPLLAVSPVGQGKLVYSALPPLDAAGDSPFPYLLSTLQNHCLVSPVLRSKRLEVYFDPGLEENVAVEDLVKRWARNGVRAVYAAAWHEYRDWTYEYDRLIELAHENGILVHAWLALPFVSEKFWEEHPEWREKNLHGQDVVVDWRRAVSLVDPACRAAVEAWIASFLAQHPFDGVNVAGLVFGGESLEKPETLAPFSRAAREDFRAQHGFDPLEIWDESSPRSWRRSGEGLRQWSEWRKAWTTRLNRDVLRAAAGARSPLALTLTVPDGLAQPEAAEASGVDVLALLELGHELPLSFQVMDCGNARPYGAERCASILADYGGRIDPARLALQVELGTSVLSGSPLYRLLASAGDATVALHSEDAIADADWPFLGPALAARTSLAPVPEGVRVKSEHGTRLAFEAAEDLWPLLDGRPWPAVGTWEILVPPGEHSLTFGSREEPAARLVDASCPILDASAVARELRFTYESRERACVVLSREPTSVAVDGQPHEAALASGARGAALLLPPGRHEVVAITESWTAFLLRTASVVLSDGIVALGGVSLVLVVALFLWGRLARGAS